jgi:hypothetical protein
MTVTFEEFSPTHPFFDYTGKVHYFSHVQKSRGTACVYLATSQSREERVRTLQFLVSYAHMKYEVRECLGVATEPIGDGRSYNFLIRRGSPPPGLFEQLESFDDPFSADVPLFLD